MRFRQVHLDFHTSGEIEKIGEKFDKRQFQEALKRGHVDSITVFSKCHHGYAFHPTKVHEMHPHLKFDLLKAELEACEEIGVRAPIYISAGLDEKEAVRHPEWLARFADESLTWVKDFTTEAGFHLLCFNTGYFELLIEQIKEVMEVYKPKGIFLDIASVHPCYCAKCRQDIINRGKDPRDMVAVMEQAELVYKNYAETVEKIVHAYNPDCTIFHNAGHITRGRRDIAGYNTHLELESLPTGGWGYDHFPMSASYVMNLGMEYLGMTGKFHTTWGEFGGFKHPNALRYETALSLAMGAKCSIGDQLHPSGIMDFDTYDLIGKAYSEVEKKEEWCKDAINLADIGILGDEAVNADVSTRDKENFADIGANRIMLEENYLYRFIDLKEDFSSFKLLILPDTIRLTSELSMRLCKYLEDGGKILASGQSGLEKDTDKFALDFGAEFKGRGLYQPDYIVPEKAFATGTAPHVIYEKGYEIAVTRGKIEASRKDSYFNRDVYHFCSHQHTPYNLQKKRAAVVSTPNTAYIGWEIFTDYGKYGSLHDKELVSKLINQLLKDEKTIQAEMPDKGIVTLTEQKEKGRYVNHLLFAHTSLRGEFVLQGQKKRVEVIEDIVPLYQVKVEVKTEHPIKRVILVPEKKELSFHTENGRTIYTVPKVECHQMIELEYEK